MSAMSTMASVPAMHEDVEERTCEQQQPQPNTEDVGAMLAHQEESGDDEQCDAHEKRSGCPEATLIRKTSVVMRMLVICHNTLPAIR
jgi:hypothetical protein